MLKQYPSGVPQHADLAVALQHIRDSLAHINEQKRDAENAAHLRALEKHLNYRSKKEVPKNIIICLIQTLILVLMTAITC